MILSTLEKGFEDARNVMLVGDLKCKEVKKKSCLKQEEMNIQGVGSYWI